MNGIRQTENHEYKTEPCQAHCRMPRSRLAQCKMPPWNDASNDSPIWHQNCTLECHFKCHIKIPPQHVTSQCQLKMSLHNANSISNHTMQPQNATSKCHLKMAPQNGTSNDTSKWHLKMTKHNDHKHNDTYQSDTDHNDTQHYDTMKNDTVFLTPHLLCFVSFDRVSFCRMPRRHFFRRKKFRFHSKDSLT